MAINREPAAVLRDEIIAEARRAYDGIINRAREEAERILATARADAKKAREEQLERARAEATRRRELILATVAVEIGRLRVGRVDSLLQSIYREARGQLLSRVSFTYREAIVNLAARAVSCMTGVAFVLKVPDRDRTLLGDGLAEEVSNRVGRSPLHISLAYDPEITDGGVVVEDAEARQTWDNRFLARLERVWPELRQQIAVKASLVPNTEARGYG